MKKLLFLIMAISPLLSFGQSDFVYSEVVQTDSSYTSSNIYSMLNDWVAKYYVDSKEVIQLKDNNANVIVGKAVMKYPYKTYKDKYIMCVAGYFKYTFKLSCKNGRFKCDIGPFYHDPTSNSFPFCFQTITTDSILPYNINTSSVWFMPKSWKQNTWVEMQKQVKDYAVNWVKSIADFVNKTKKEDNW